MEKFISIPVTASSVTSNQLISATNVVSVFAGAITTNTLALANTAIMYQGGKVVTLTHAAQTAFNMRNAIQSAIATALQTSWTETVYVVPSLPITVTAITSA
jgi:hypothetical protein